MAAVLQGRDLSSVRVPLGGDKVYKDECVYCFDTPVSMHVITMYVYCQKPIRELLILCTVADVCSQHTGVYY